MRPNQSQRPAGASDRFGRIARKNDAPSTASCATTITDHTQNAQDLTADNETAPILSQRDSLWQGNPFGKPSPHRAQRRRLSGAVPKSVVVFARHRGGGFASAVLTICGSRLFGQSARAGYRVARLGPCAEIDQLAARTAERTRRIVGPIFHRGTALRTAYKRRSHKLQ